MTFFNLVKRSLRPRGSLGTRLLFYVLGGTCVGLGMMSLLVYHALHQRAEAEIQEALSIEVGNIEKQLAQVETFTRSSGAAVQAARQQNFTRSQYEALLVEFAKQHPDLVMGSGMAQTAYGILTTQRWFLPYFYTDQGEANATGKLLPIPDESLRYVDVATIENYSEQGYYRDAIEAGKPFWNSPYDWQGITMMTYSYPLRDQNNRIIGYTLADVNVTAISQKINRKVIQDQGYFAIFSQQGELLGYPPNPDKAKARASYQDIPKFKAIWQQIQQSSGFVQTHGMILSHKRIPSTNWIMIAAVPQRAVIVPVLAITLGSALGASAILFWVVNRFIRQVNKRLQPIVQECNQLAQIDAKLEGEFESCLLQPLPRCIYNADANLDELDMLSSAFDHMSCQLRAVLATLDQRIVERTAALQSAMQDTDRVNGKLKRLNSELEQRVLERTEALSSTMEELKRSQLQRIQSEKMLALGSLVAGVAHEINNPIGFIAGNLQPACSYVQDLLTLIALYQDRLPHPDAELSEALETIDLEFVQQDLLSLLNSMKEGVERIRTISVSLRTFSRADGDRPTVVDLLTGLDSTLLILRHRLKANSYRPAIRVIKNYGELPPVECYLGQLNQVFMNLLANAIDALDDRSQKMTLDELKDSPNVIEITIAVQEQRSLLIHIADNGAGIPEEIRSRIFEPFFTTKGLTQGTGLGLSISHQIVTQKHKGQLSCDSAPGKGTKFTIEIPLRFDAALNPETSPSPRDYSGAPS